MKQGVRQRLAGMTVMILLCGMMSGCSRELEIYVVGEGKSYDVNDRCKVWESYEEYNVQVPVEQLAGELMEEGAQKVELKVHTVMTSDDTTSESGKYDVVDTVKVAITGADPLGILPQTIQKTIEYKRNKESGEWVVINRACTGGTIQHKGLGGTVWKKSTSEGDIYIRLRDTIEFFFTKHTSDNEKDSCLAFDTTITGAMATVKNGEVSLERIHIIYGTVTMEGTITMKVVIGDKEIELVLNEYEQIQKSDLPFTEEEYRVLVDV